jgi:hypothetical protein
MNLWKTLIMAATILIIAGSAFAQTGHWSEPVPVPNINTYYHEYYPSISPDGLTLYFARSNNIMISHWNGQEWGEPVDAGPNINAGQRQIKASVTPDNSTLYFTSWRAGGYGTYDIWRTYWQDSCQCWGPAEVLPPPISTEYMETDVQLSYDGHKMYISSDRRFSWGDLDIWCSDWIDSTQDWGDPQNLGLGLNSSTRDYSAYPTIDGNTLYFASWGTHGFEYPQWMGPVDLFIAHYNGQSWGNIEIMPAPITTGYWEDGPAVTNDGRTLYFASTRPGGPGLTDIYETHFISAIDDSDDNSDTDTQKLDMNVFPNPANNTINFIFPHFEGNEKRKLTIFDIRGQQILKTNLANERNYVWSAIGPIRREVPSGCYFALYECGGYKVSKKFLLLK